jgi:hypothetical protein
MHVCMYGIRPSAALFAVNRVLRIQRWAHSFDNIRALVLMPNAGNALGIHTEGLNKELRLACET